MGSRDRWYELTEGAGSGTEVAEPVGHDDSLRYRLSEAGPVVEPLTLTWTWSSVRPPTDLVVTVDSVRLVSPAVRDIFTAHAGPADDIQWLPATVIDSGGLSLPHWVPHFPTEVDVLDAEATTWGPSGLPIRYVFSAEKLAGHAVTVYWSPATSVHAAGRTSTIPPSSAFLTYVISAEVAEALRAANITGARITPAPVSHGSDPPT